jgi:hypothetical protein
MLCSTKTGTNPFSFCLFSKSSSCTPKYAEPGLLFGVELGLELELELGPKELGLEEGWRCVGEKEGGVRGGVCGREWGAKGAADSARRRLSGVTTAL